MNENFSVYNVISPIPKLQFFLTSHRSNQKNTYPTHITHQLHQKNTLEFENTLTQILKKNKKRTCLIRTCSHKFVFIYVHNQCITYKNNVFHLYPNPPDTAITTSTPTHHPQVLHQKIPWSFVTPVTLSYNVNV